MAALTYHGPYEQVFPHLPGRSSGTLVLVPGEEYDFGDGSAPGPAWWWAAPPPPEPARTAPAAERAPAAGRPAPG